MGGIYLGSSEAKGSILFRVDLKYGFRCQKINITLKTRQNDVVP
jgi:hypothetical protein